ncbi:MAG TPA: acetyl-CoA C-acyltransferase [Myxococcota bacterium]|jgi:3-oxoadipyl-CoA thiolase|nr:acetyl-CoA C-acyltransferase [Myxococcota bacterium]
MPKPSPSTSPTREVFVVDALRTPIGRHGGALAPVRPDDLAGHAIAALVARTRVPPDAVDDVVFGCVNQAGEDNRNVARMALLLAGLPHAVPGVTVNRLCASSLEAIAIGARAIRAGDAEVVVAGGVESMTRAPLVMPKPGEAWQTGNRTVFDTTLGWRFPNPRLEALFPLEQMGETAETLAERWHIGREEQDRFSLDSHRKAVAAQEGGRFDGEIVPVPVPQRKGPPQEVRADEGPRRDTTLEKLAGLKPAFRAGGTVTAGNSSTLNDGAAALLLASAEAVARHGFTPIARFVTAAAAGVDPRLMGIGPVPASRRALDRAGLSVADVDVFELNEAFAVQVLAVAKDLEIDLARVNLNGGAIALGHPLGGSGARIATTLIHLMRADPSRRRGLASMCVGVGQGVAAIFERV